MKSHFRNCLTSSLMLLACCGLAEACPTCKQAVSESGGNLIQGYFWSILFMMSMPFLILGGLSTMFYWEVRRARARQQTLQQVARQQRPLQSGHDDSYLDRSGEPVGTHAMAAVGSSR